MDVEPLWNNASVVERFDRQDVADWVFGFADDNITCCSVLFFVSNVRLSCDVVFNGAHFLYN